MKRWNQTREIENPKIDAFLEEIIEVCKRHGYSIGHEDCHGAFVIEKADEENFAWLRRADDSTGEIL